MARGNARRAWVQAPNNSNNVTLKINKGPEVTSIHDVLKEIDSHWASMPAAVRTFLLSKPDQLGLYALVEFWSGPLMRQYTVGGMCGSICGASWFIASQYLRIGMFSEARALTLNGGFLHQCFHLPIEEIVDMCRGEYNVFCKPVSNSQLPLFSRALWAIHTPEKMDSFLKKGLPEEYQKMMHSFSKISNTDNKMEYIDQISDDWKSSSSRKQKPSSKTSDGTQLQLIIADGSEEGQRHSFDIGSSTALKKLFNDYADERGVSLRSLRFSYQGKTLFLSGVSNKSPDEMNMKDQDVIVAHDTNAPQEPTSSTSSSPSKKSSSSKKSKAKNRPKKKKGRKVPVKQEESTETLLEECKAQHSKMLTKLHEEVEPRLKEIRTRLNALDLRRQPPKQKKKSKKKKKGSAGGYDNQVLPNSGLGGKAGKPYFIVQIGEVENLFKTQKPNHCQNSSTTASSIDLHGYTKNEALETLNKNLPDWVDTAMQGEYPFVTQVKIICGCGNQIVSDVVQDWIKSSRNVCNAPKSCIV